MTPSDSFPVFKHKPDMKNTTTLPILFLVLLSIGSCRQKGGQEASEESSSPPSSPLSYREGDTLRLNPGGAPNLAAWFAFYSKADPGWRASGFKASGVNIHIDSFERAPDISAERMRAFAPLFSWSPDSSLCLDLWSYNRLVESDVDGRPLLAGGGPDQMVVLSDGSGLRRRQVLFNGPMQVTETADWVSKDAFVMGMLNLDESAGLVTPEILLFNLSDTVYTNFRYARSIPVDSLPAGDNGFLEGWLVGLGFRQDLP